MSAMTVQSTSVLAWQEVTSCDSHGFGRRDASEALRKLTVSGTTSLPESASLMVSF